MPDAWREGTLGELLTLEYGKALPERDRDGEGHPVFGSSGIVGLHSQPLVPGPGIVVGRKGTAGSVLWSEDDFYPIDTTYWVKLLDTTTTDLRFTSLLLEGVDLPGICASTGVPGLNRDRAYEIPVRLPSLPEQWRIVDLITALDAQIEALDREASLAGDLLCALRQREFSSLDATEDLASVVSEMRAGGTPSRKNAAFYGGGVPWLKSGEVSNPWISDTDEKITPEAIRGSSAWVVPAGSVVVAMYGATAAQVGYLAAPMATNQAVLALVPDPQKCDGRFLYHWFCHHSAALKDAASGAAQPNLSKAVIQREMSFPALDPAMQSEISQMLDAADAVARALADEAETLRDCRTRMLSSLLGAEIEIPDSFDALLTEAV